MKLRFQYTFAAVLILSLFLFSTVGAQVQPNSFKPITVTPQTTTARIVATSIVPVPIKGDIFILKNGGSTVSFCNGVDFPSGIVSAPCDADNLTPGTTYTVRISAKDATTTKEYEGTTSFTTKGTTTTTQNPPTTTTTTTGTQTTGGGVFTAQQNPNSTTNNSGQASGFQLDVRLQNPLKVNTIQDAVKFFVDTLLKIAIPFIVIFFLWAGLKFILAQGKPEKIKEAKQMFWYTIIGTLLILGAWTITNAIIGTVNSITN